MCCGRDAAAAGAVRWTRRTPDSGWAAFEVDGVRRTRDGGETWEKAALEITNPDIHCVLVSAGPPKTVFVLVNDDVWSSTDDGETWKPANARSTFPWHYVRRHLEQAGRAV